MIASNIPFKAKQIAKVAGCSRRTIQRKKSNIRKFGSIKATPNPCWTILKHYTSDIRYYLWTLTERAWDLSRGDDAYYLGQVQGGSNNHF
jgi:hypothetical protein